MGKTKFQKFILRTILKVKKRDMWRWRVMVGTKISCQLGNCFENCYGEPKFYTDTQTHT